MTRSTRERTRALAAGDVAFGRFDIEGFAGAGAMGEVYKARDRTSGDFVALKLLRGESARQVERFAREARALEGLAHARVVRYVAHGEGDEALGCRWLAME
jgi:serine/threonine protein kinase